MGTKRLMGKENGVLHVKNIILKVLIHITKGGCYEKNFLWANMHFINIFYFC